MWVKMMFWLWFISSCSCLAKSLGENMLLHIRLYTSAYDSVYHLRWKEVKLANKAMVSLKESRYMEGLTSLWLVLATPMPWKETIGLAIWSDWVFMWHTIVDCKKIIHAASVSFAKEWDPGEVDVDEGAVAVMDAMKSCNGWTSS